MPHYCPPVALFKRKFERWTSDPPQVTSYLCLSRSRSPPGDSPTYISPGCGFGWQFCLEQKWDGGEMLGLTFRPGGACSEMPIREMVAHIVATFPESARLQNLPIIKKYSGLTNRTAQAIGLYGPLSTYAGDIHFEITVSWTDINGFSISIPNSVAPLFGGGGNVCTHSSPPDLRKALLSSLNSPAFVDAKFYLFSARSTVNGQPIRPRAIFSRTDLLIQGGGQYIINVLSSGRGSHHNGLCNLYHDNTPEASTELDPSAYEYQSDSDLDEDGDQDGNITAHRIGQKAAPVIATGAEDRHRSLTPASNGGQVCESAQTHDGRPEIQYGRAFSINGTAYRTWKAFVIHAYTNEIEFSPLKSQGNLRTKCGHASCSPKSMFRFADTANLPRLRLLAKGAIRQSLRTSNIVHELFSSFTYRYPEIIKLEVDFLVANFTEEVSRDFDNELQVLVSGVKPHCLRVLTYAMKRLRGDNSAAAWNALNENTQNSAEAGTSVDGILAGPVKVQDYGLFEEMPGSR